MKSDDANDGIAKTKIYERKEFFEKADEMIRKSGPRFYILSSINIDNFKVINAQYGVGVGDKVLTHVARSVEETMGKIGGICGHIAGDEFAALFPTSYAKSKLLADSYADAGAPSCIFQRIRIRVGRFVVDALSETVNDMYDSAKLAANNIRDNYEKDIEYYKDYMRTELVERQQIIYEMRDALGLGQFEPWFQPQYNHATGALIGAEVLVRWKKNGKYISPGEFVPIFEQNGFIYELDKYIWEQSCRLLRRWTDEGKKPLPLAVNVSRRDILHDDFLPFITSLIEKYELENDMLRFEITESAFAESSKEITRKVKQLIDLGFTVEIDDFGSGYLSLNTLKDVPASILKLDMRFFEKTENNLRAGNIVESVVRMAKWLGMAVIAEGVENIELADYLKSIGCYYIQGYFYAKPMPVDDYEKLLDGGLKEHRLSRLKTLKTLDNNQFWNPKSMDTLIFNSYVGGACIFEYHKGKTHILRLNDQYIRQFGGIIPCDTELYGAAVSRYMDSENRTKLFEAIEKAVDTRKEAFCEVAVSNSERTEFIRVTVRTIARTDDRILCYAVVVNVTEQRMAEIHEKNMARQLDTMMRSIHASVTATVFNNRSDMNVIYINDGFYKMYGYTKEQYENEVNHINDLILPEDYPMAMEAVERVISTRCPETHEFRCIKRDGSIVWVQMTNSVIDLDGIAENVLMGIAIDVTPQREYHEQLKFLNAAAHDILAHPDCEKAIDSVLEKIISFFMGERAYVFETDFDKNTVTNTFELCISNVEKEKNNLQNVPFDIVSPWYKNFAENKFVKIENVGNMDDSQKELRELLLMQNISSLIVSPLWRDKNLSALSVWIIRKGRLNILTTSPRWAIISRFCLRAAIIQKSLTKNKK